MIFRVNTQQSENWTSSRRKNKRQFSRSRVNESVIMSFELLTGSLTAWWRKSVRRNVRRCKEREKERRLRERHRRPAGVVRTEKRDSFYDVDRVHVKNTSGRAMNYLYTSMSHQQFRSRRFLSANSSDRRWYKEREGKMEREGDKYFIVKPWSTSIVVEPDIGKLPIQRELLSRGLSYESFESDINIYFPARNQCAIIS